MASFNKLNLDPRIKRIPEGYGYGNAWLLAAENGYVLIDPAVPPEKVELKDQVMALIATHGHYDHVGKADAWRSFNRKLELMIHEAEADMIMDKTLNASLFFGRGIDIAKPDILLRDGQEIELGNNLFLRVFHTPGHTGGSCCFLYLSKPDAERENYIALITGDTVFATDIGRMDLAGGSEEQMRRSLARLRKLREELPSDLPVLPGHGSATTLEKLQKNYWFMHH